MGGVRRDPLERKILGGGGVKLEKPSVGGVWIFSGTTQYNREYILKTSKFSQIDQFLFPLKKPLIFIIYLTILHYLPPFDKLPSILLVENLLVFPSFMTTDHLHVSPLFQQSSYLRVPLFDKPLILIKVGFFKGVTFWPKIVQFEKVRS